VGVELEVVKSWRLKDIGSPVRDLSEEERQVLQDLVDDVWRQFVEAVVLGRDLSRARVEELADGRVYSGERARDEGLIDRLGTLQDALDAAGRMGGLGENPRTVRPTQEKVGLLELLGGVEESRLATLLESVSGGASSMPRLKYEWP
jgi:protease-4